MIYASLVIGSLAKPLEAACGQPPALIIRHLLLPMVIVYLPILGMMIDFYNFREKKHTLTSDSRFVGIIAV